MLSTTRPRQLTLKVGFEHRFLIVIDCISRHMDRVLCVFVCWHIANEVPRGIEGDVNRIDESNHSGTF